MHAPPICHPIFFSLSQMSYENGMISDLPRPFRLSEIRISLSRRKLSGTPPVAWGSKQYDREVSRI